MHAAVIVPTRDRPYSLERCLAALERQTGPASLEVLVIDDGSRDADAVDRIVRRASRARLLRRPQPGGPAAARNEGVRAVDAPIVLFTDDDCVPAPDWVARLTNAIEDGADVVAGVTVNGRPQDALASASEAVLSFVQRDARGRGPTTTFAATNNLACTARVAAEIPFDETYRHAEDREWCARVVEAGYAFVVEPGAAVAHHQELTFGTFWRKHVGYGRGAYRFRRRASRRGFEPPRFYAGLLREGFAESSAAGLLLGLTQLATAVGFVQEALSERARSARRN